MVDHKKLRELAYSPDLLNAYCNVPATVIALLDEIDGLRKDAERYRWLSRRRWWSSDMFVVTGGAQSVKLGVQCPSGRLLDVKIDSAMAQEGESNCTRCGGEMKPGQALESTLVGEPDDIGGCVTVSPGGPGKLVPCMKCAECGWSVTVGSDK